VGDRDETGEKERDIDRERGDAVREGES